MDYDGNDHEYLEEIEKLDEEQEELLRRAGLFIKAEREARGWSQSELARHVKAVKAAAISGYEIGRRQPSLAVLSRVSKAFGHAKGDVDWLLGLGTREPGDSADVRRASTRLREIARLRPSAEAWRLMHSMMDAWYASLQPRG